MTWQPLVPEPSALGESPFWHPTEQRLYWVDIDGKKINRCVPGEGAAESWVMPSEPGCMAPLDGGGLVIALREGVYLAPQWGGALTLLATFAYDPATTRFNDGKADPFGRFWAGTIFEPRTTPEAVLYCVDNRAAGQPLVSRQAGGATVANGLAWSPDGRTLYWGDTSSHTVRAWDWDGERNVLSAERVFKTWPAKPEGWAFDQPDSAQRYGGRPDGATVDAEGNYYAAMFEGARIAKLSPAGEVLQEFPVPAQCPTMPCFGGPDLKTLFVTTARHKRPAAELARYPNSGCVFSMRVDTPGLPVNLFRHGTANL